MLSGSLIQVQESQKKAILSFAGLGIKPHERKEHLRHCFLFSGLLLIATRSSNGKLHLHKVNSLRLFSTQVYYFCILSYRIKFYQTKENKVLYQTKGSPKSGRDELNGNEIVLTTNFLAKGLSPKCPVLLVAYQVFVCF